MNRPPLVHNFIRGDKLSGKMSQAVISYIALLEAENNNLQWVLDNTTKVGKPKESLD